MTAEIVNAIAAIFWTYLIHSTVLLSVCAALIRFTQPKSHALTAWLWKSAAVLPMATSIVTLGLSTTSMQFGFVIENKLFFRNPVTVSRMDAVPAARSTADLAPHLEELTLPNSSDLAEGETHSAHDLSQQRNMLVDSVSEVPTNAEREPVEQASFAPSSLAVLVFLLGTSCWCLSRIILLWCSIRKLVRSTTECQSGELRGELDRLLKTTKIKRQVRLFISDEATQPFALGILQWTIVVPRQFAVALEKKQLRAMFAHELGHLVLRDAVWIVIGGFLCTFLAFQPLNFLARRRWLDASEFLADEWAVRSGVSALTLVRCLTSVAEWRSDSLIPTAMPFAKLNANALTRRAEHLLSGETKRAPWTALRHLSANLALTITGLLFVFLGPHVGGLRANEYELCDSVDSAQFASQLIEIADRLRDVSDHLSQLDLNSDRLIEVDEVKERVKKLKRRSALLVNRTEVFLELCKKDLP